MFSRQKNRKNNTFHFTAFSNNNFTENVEMFHEFSEVIRITQPTKYVFNDSVQNTFY